VSPFTVLLAGVFGLLRRYSSDDDIVIGTPVANRERRELEDQVGLYLNTLAIRVRVEPHATLATLVGRVRDALLEAQAHQAYPFDSLVQDLKLPRTSNRNPLFDVMAVMQDAVRPEFRAPGVRGVEYPVTMSSTLCDLTFHFTRQTGTRLALEFNTGLFGRERVQRLAAHLDRVIEAIVSTPEASLEDVDVLAEDEKRRIIEEFGQGPALPAPDRTVVEMFADRARENPERTAVMFEQRSLTYGRLAAAAARVAEQIRHTGIPPQSVVALVTDRSEWMVAGVIGIMASGAACLPIDATQPLARRRRILEDSGCRAIVSDLPDAAASSLPVRVSFQYILLQYRHQ
jgi:non-ribosomal peptide synthetase component F